MPFRTHLKILTIQATSSVLDWMDHSINRLGRAFGAKPLGNENPYELDLKTESREPIPPYKLGSPEAQPTGNKPQPILRDL